MNKMKKVLCALLAVVAMTGMFSACGGSKTSTAASASTSTSESTVPDSVMIDSEYEDAVANLATQMQDIQTKSAQLDANDIDGVKKLIDEMKAPFQEFVAITPPEKYADAHVKMKSGCEAMIAYCDDILAIMDGDTNAATKMSEDLQKASTDLSAASTMMNEAK